jgi:hypothetical protein
MKCVGKGVLATIGLICTPLMASAARLEANWIGTNGNGGEGNWNTPSNWNLGVVPNNGTDGDGDGVADIFDVRIDSLPALVSLVHSDAPPAEIAGLSIDEGDILELTQQPPFVLRDPDSDVDLINNGLVRVGGRRDNSPMLAFAGDTLRLSGNGTIELGLRSSEHARFAALDGGRIINGASHTLQSAGLLQAGRIHGYVPDVTTADVALTNEGTILALDGGILSLRLNEETHTNAGTIRASDRADLSMSAPGGTFRNSSLMLAERQGEISLGDVHFVNEPGGVMRLDSGGKLVFNGQTGNANFENAGVIEAANGGIIHFKGKNVVNRGAGVVRIATGSQIQFSEGTFQTDPAIQLLDADSRMFIDAHAIVENYGRVLTPGPGVLVIGGVGSAVPSVLRGGELTNGEGTLILNAGSRLEDVYVRGTVSGTGMEFGGQTVFDADFTIQPSGLFFMRSPQTGFSFATDLVSGAQLMIDGNLYLGADSKLIVLGAGDGNSHVIAYYTGRRSGTFGSVTPGYNVTYNDVNKWIQVEPVPEPASVALALVGGIAAVTLRLRNRRPRQQAEA